MRKKTFIFLIFSCLGLAGLSWAWLGRPAEQKIGVSAPELVQGPAAPQRPAPDEPAPTSTIVEFANDVSKQNFLTQNGLRGDELRPIPGTTAFEVPRANVSAPGVKAHQNVSYHSLLAPNDPLHPQWFSTRVGSNVAWDLTTGSSSVTVAVIDTGFALSHQEFSNRWYTNAGEVGGGKETNGVDDDANGFIDDWRGWDFSTGDNDPSAGTTQPTHFLASHGTAVAGMVAASGNNSVGLAGVDWSAKILPLQALGDNGSGFTSGVVAAVNYARQAGAKVINLSLGSQQPDALLQQAIDQAVAAGVVVVAASGNDGCDCITYPARYANVVAVGASDENDNRASFSSYGGALDIIAPGTGAIRTTLWSQANPTSLYSSSIAGTSIATPFVSGMASMFLAARPAATQSEIVASLTRGAEKVGAMGGASFTTQHGFGRSNLWASTRLATATHPDGTLIVRPDNGTVYLLQGGQKRRIPSIEVFLSYYQDVLAQAKTATIADLELADGPDLNFRSGTLIKGSGPSVYALSYVGSTLQKQHISSSEAYAQLGYQSNEWIPVSDGFLSTTADGATLLGIGPHPDGTLIRQAGQLSVYLLENGTRRHVPSPPVLQSFNKGKFVVRSATAADMALTEGDPMTFEEGAVVTGSGLAIYAVDHSGSTVTKRHIQTIGIHILLQFTEQERLQVPGADLPTLDGAPIN